MEAKKMYQRKPNFIARNIAGETLLVPIAGKVADLQRVIALNAVGAFIWERLESPRHIDGLVEGVVATFAVETEAARRDATEFLGQLEAANLIDPVV
ncbi:MAG: PqqD family protein [Kiritimatiellaeota bacterium]|nr:PqqD family protein [Kiritimatiellota bacterium]